MSDNEKQELINELRIVIDTIWQDYNFHNLREIYQDYTNLNNLDNSGGSLKTRVKKN